MTDFNEALRYVNQKLYQPNGLTIESIQEEKQNAKYGAGRFELSSKTIRFRVAKITPTKVGQFVAFWEKDENNKNQPYLYDDAPDLLVITTFKSDRDFGQFVFPKDVLLRENVLRSSSTEGKMALRVYPVWDRPTSKQALKTQAWQAPYFVDLSHPEPLSIERMKALYAL